MSPSRTAAFFAILLFWISGIFAAQAKDVEFDRKATGVAQLLAGIAPAAGDPVFDRLAATDSWKAHTKAMEKQFVEVRTRLAAMERWRDREVSIPPDSTKTLLYPFSGPDFLNAHTLFPDHGQYVFFSLENPGALPDLDEITPKQFESLLTDVRGALRDIFQRNYFITSYMSKQLTTHWVRGTVPVMATMMALTNQRIVRIETIDPFPELNRSYEEQGKDRPAKRMRAVRIDFVNATGGKPQHLYYYSLNVTDKALAYYPDFLPMIARVRPATAFIKSASYLLHDNQFSRTREMVLEAADVLVQDDTGIPYRFLRKAGWEVTLHGQYARPIKSLAYGYQADLEIAYRGKSANAALPFPFGYHWNNGKSGILVATRERR